MEPQQQKHALPSARAVFDHALELRSPAERQAYLSQACGGDAAFRQKVDALLRAYEDAGDFLESPAPALGLDATMGQPIASVPLREGPGTEIGPYKLLEQIGEGGMGVVFLAEQQRPVRRQVALKVIKAGMDTRQVVGRFETERQTLALMDHPNIAKVLDAGATDSGRPYFVMELVKGVPITRYCDEQCLTPKDRLSLFVQVCNAVQHAHTKGIIHRDLKPSNVLVALYDGTPVPKVIDFGVAKATGGRLTEHTVFTGFGGVVGTLEYMSPEQAELNQLDVDTRSDVYSLGVLLYELLTGSTPVQRGRFKEAALLEVLRVVREEEAPRPSTRLSTADQLASIAACRGLEPKKLGGVVRGELDWIVMRCLEKNRARRYETAHNLAKDVARYLDGEAVQACPPSATYRFRKFARRNRGVLAAAATIAVVLVSATAASTWWAVRATRAEGLAQTRFEAEAVARAEAEGARKQAKAQLAVSEAVFQFINDDLLGQADPRSDSGGGLTLRAVVDRASENLGARLHSQPLVEAAIRQTLGRAYWSLGEYPLAERHLLRAVELRRASGEEHPRTLHNLSALATVYAAQGRYADAEKLRRQVLEARRRLLGEEHPATLEMMSSLAGSSFELGRHEEADLAYRTVLATCRRVLGEDDPQTLLTLSNLATVCVARHRYVEAEDMQRVAAAGLRRVRGDEHPLTIRVSGQLATTLALLRKDDEALRLAEQALAASLRVLGEHHPDTVVALGGMRMAMENKGDLEQALQFAEQVWAISRRVYGDDNQRTREARASMANLSMREAWRLSMRPPSETGQPARALSVARRSLELDPQGPAAFQVLGWAEYRNGHWKAAIEALEKSCSLQMTAAGGDSFQWMFLAMAHWQSGDQDLARAWYAAACREGKVDDGIRTEAAGLLGLPERWPPAGWEPGPADLRVYGRVIELNPRATRVLGWRLAARRKLGQVDEATDDALAALERLSRADGRPSGTRRECYRELVGWDEVFRRVAAVRGGELELWVERGSVLSTWIAASDAEPALRSWHWAEMKQCHLLASDIASRMRLAPGGSLSDPASREELTAVLWKLQLWQAPLAEADEPAGPFGGAAAAIPGTIQAENFDRGGLGSAYGELTFENGGTDKRYRSTAVDVDVCKDEGGGHNVGGIVPGEWLAYTIDVAEDGLYDLDLRVCVPVGGGKLHLDSGGKDLTGPLELPQTGDWDTWTTFTRNGVRLKQGRQVMRVYFDSVVDPSVAGSGQFLCNLNWIRMRPSAAIPDGAPPG